VVATPGDEGETWALYDRAADPGETRDLTAARPDVARVWRRELELFRERGEKEWAHTRALIQPGSPARKLPPDVCEWMKANGYTDAGCP